MNAFLTRLRHNPSRIVWFLTLCFMILIVFLPIFFMFKFSISDRSSIVTGGEIIPLWPYHATFKTYGFILGYPDFYRAAGVSFKVAVIIRKFP